MLIGDLSKACGCSAETIRYYEKIRLLPQAIRRNNGYREYNETHQRILQFIIRTKNLGFSQDDIRQLTDLARHEKSACSRVFDILDQQHLAVGQRIAQLHEMEQALLRLKRKCRQRGKPRDCPVLDELMR